MGRWRLCMAYPTATSLSTSRVNGQSNAADCQSSQWSQRRGEPGNRRNAQRDHSAGF